MSSIYFPPLNFNTNSSSTTSNGLSAQDVMNASREANEEKQNSTPPAETPGGRSSADKLGVANNFISAAGGLFSGLGDFVNSITGKSTPSYTIVNEGGDNSGLGKWLLIGGAVLLAVVVIIIVLANRK